MFKKLIPALFLVVAAACSPMEAGKPGHQCCLKCECCKEGACECCKDKKEGECLKCLKSKKAKK